MRMSFKLYRHGLVQGLRLRHYSIKSGQPLHETRPHLIQPGELTPFITAEEFYARRQRILDSIPDQSLVIVPGNETQFASESVFYEFRQDPNFQYLTGFLEPGAALMLHRESASNTKSILFVPESNKETELWDGEKAGVEGAKSIFNADESYPVTKIGSVLQRLLADTRKVYMDTFESKSSRFPRFFRSHGRDVFKESMLEILKGHRLDVASAVNLVEKSRIVKSESEIDALRIAAEISSDVFNKAFTKKFAKEADLAAFLDYEFRIGGCESSAYVPVVAGGNHALTIHYTRNDDVLVGGDLVLVDAAGRYGGYCADISRTWPVNGKFSEPQRDLYQAVLNVQKRCIELCKVSSGLSLTDLHRSSEKFMYTELVNAGFKDLTHRDVSILYPHFIGHHLGLDVHDITMGSRHSPLEISQVITIEPGVYVPYDSKWPKHFQGIGIRIEDDVVVGPDSYEVLTENTLKEIKDLEAL